MKNHPTTPHKMRVFQHYPELKKRLWSGKLWSRGYCVSTVGLDEDKIRKYVKWQEGREKQQEVDDEKAEVEPEVDDFKDKYIRLSAEFDNYRRRTLNEKINLTKTASESVITKLLPVIDDFDRAMTAMKETKDCDALHSGIELIYGKLNEFLTQQGVKVIDAFEKEFDTDLHEALTKIPAPKKKLKNKVVDVIEKGYTLNDKVIRFSKVVIGE